MCERIIANLLYNLFIIKLLGKFLMILRFFLFFLTLLSLEAATITKDTNDNNKSKFYMIIPYALSTESTGVIAGVAGIWSGYGQKQMSIVTTAYVGMETEVQNTLENSTKNKARAYAGVIGIRNYQPYFLERMYISFLGSYAYYPNQALYIEGENSSSHDDVLRTQGYNNWYNMTFSYALPMGEYKNSSTITYDLDRGLPVGREDKGGGVPFTTGTTIVELIPFYNRWTADKLTQEPAWTTLGLRLRVEHDNTDYMKSPSRGYSFDMKYSQDFGNLNSTQSWNTFEASYTQFVEIPHASWMRQNVIALNFWSAYSPSWKNGKYYDKNSKYINANRPPPWEGARLGGFYRMRGYASNRFNDKAALYYGAEYRFIPNFNPLNKKENTWMPIGIDWFQGVLFAEAGRVAPEYNIGELHTDMKYDVGMSLRALAAKVPIRFEFAYGGEGSSMWMMVGQTF